MIIIIIIINLIKIKKNNNNPFTSEWFFDQVQSLLQIHAEIHEDPVDSFSLVLFLLQNEHVVVEKLLQLLIGVVDAQLFERVKVENLETGNIQDSDEKVASQVGRQRAVNDVDQPLEAG